MIRDAAESLQRHVAEACAQAFDQRRPIEHLAVPVVEKVAMQGTERRQVVRDERQRVHRRRELDAFEPRTRELEQRRSVALRREKADLDARRRAALVTEHEREALHAAVARDEERRELAHEALQRERERVLRLDSERELEPALEAIRGPVTNERFRDESAHPVEMIERARSDAARELRAW